MKNQILNVKSLIFLFAIILLTYGVQGISYGQRAVTIDDGWTCTIDWDAGQTLQLTVRGTVRATRNVQAVVIRAFVVALNDEEFLGDDHVGDLSAGESKNFEITEVVVLGRRITQGTVSCVVLPPLYDLPEPDPPDNNEQPGGTTYEFGDVIRTLPTDLTPSDVDDFDNAGMSISSTTTDGTTTTTTRITRFGKDGYIVVDDITYICVASGGCTIYGRQVTQGRIQSVHSDLVVEQVSVSKSTLAPGEAFTLSATVRNQGTDNAAATTLSYRYLMFDVDGTILTDTISEVGTDDVGALGANESSAHSINLTAPTSPGTHYYGAVVIDSENPRSNNVDGVIITVKGFDFDFSVPAGISMIHVPLDVTKVDGVAKTIESISDLYNTLGGSGVVTFLITYDPATGDWLSYFGASDKGTATDRTLTDDMGIIANLITPTTIRLTGAALGTGGSSTISLTPGLNLVGLPLRDSTINRVSDLFTLDGIGGNVPVIILNDGGEFKSVGQVGDPGDIPIVGGQGFILTAQQGGTVTISGEPWTNTSGTAAASPVVFRGLEVRDTTPVLALRGAVIDEHAAFNKLGFHVTVKNLSTGRTIAGMTKAEGGAYKLTVVDIEMGQAAAIGDVLEISAQSPNPLIGVEPLRYTLTAEDVKQSLIQLPELVAYEIPAETQLLPNYPNPFNPETWIPYRLAEDAFVTLTIYDGSGQVVRTIDVGYQTAAVYESRSKAIYWDGRNEFGETVASGVYFYQLRAGDHSQTRKMLILK